MGEPVIWAILGDCVAGTSHRDRGTPCQDAFRYRCIGEYLVVAVADGAGSAAHSEIGATLACDELVKRAEVEFAFTREWALDLFAGVRNELLSRAELLGIRPRELACTALLAVVGPEVAAFVQLGDGAIVVGDGTAYRTVFWPDPTEYANATDFLTDDRYADVLQFAISTESITELAVLTDGLQRVALDFAARVPHPPFFRPLFRRLWDTPECESLLEPFRTFLDSPALNARTDDDKTLVLAVRRS